MSDFDLFDWDTWGVDELFDNKIVDFAIDTFDTFVFDTGKGGQGNLMGSSGSIWQQGWDYIDDLWGGDDAAGSIASGDDIYPTPDGQAIPEILNQSQNGLLGRLSDSLGKKADEYIDSGDIWSDAAAGGVSMAKDHYKDKKNKEKMEEAKSIREKSDRMSKHGFTSHRGGFAR